MTREPLEYASLPTKEKPQMSLVRRKANALGAVILGMVAVAFAVGGYIAGMLAGDASYVAIGMTVAGVSLISFGFVSASRLDA